MDSLLLDIREMLEQKIKTQENNRGYIIKETKAYYDMEMSLKIAVKVFVFETNTEEIIILGGNYLLDLTTEDEQKWWGNLH